MPTIFSSWTRQAGFPIVTVNRFYEDRSFILNQERYFTVNQTTTSTSQWWIPYNYATASSHEFEFTNATSWFSTLTERVTDPNILPTDWLLLNKRQTGYYRVKYDLQNYKLLAEQLQNDLDVIHLTSRSQLIDDAFDFARTERLGYDVVFDLLKYLEHEVEYVPWASTIRGLTYVDRLLAGSVEYERFTVRSICIPLITNSNLIFSHNRRSSQSSWTTSTPKLVFWRQPVSNSIAKMHVTLPFNGPADSEARSA